MDSLSQVALGASVAVIALGGRTAVWKAAAWGAVAGTLPDLDTFIDHGDPVSNMTFHRAESHALFWLTLCAVPLGLAVARLVGEWPQWRRWLLATWLALFTHPLLDGMTVYGTQLLLPFSDAPLGVDSMFIIDPLFTLPLLVGLAVALRRRDARGLAWNRWALAVGTGYLAWSAAAQAHIRDGAERALEAQGLGAERLLVTPAPFNTLLWRLVAVTPDGRYHEGFRSLLDAPDQPWRFDAFDQGRQHWPLVQDRWHAQRMRWFTHGFWKLEVTDAGVILTDLRMGQEPGYVFAFLLPNATASQPAPPPIAAGVRGDIGRGLRWLGPRMLGQDLPPPR